MHPPNENTHTPNEYKDEVASRAGAVADDDHDDDALYYVLEWFRNYELQKEWFRVWSDDVHVAGDDEQHFGGEGTVGMTGDVRARSRRGMAPYRRNSTVPAICRLSRKRTCRHLKSKHSTATLKICSSEFLT